MSLLAMIEIKTVTNRIKRRKSKSFTNQLLEDFDQNMRKNKVNKHKRPKFKSYRLVAFEFLVIIHPTEFLNISFSPKLLYFEI